MQPRVWEGRSRKNISKRTLPQECQLVEKQFCSEHSVPGLIVPCKPSCSLKADQGPLETSQLRSLIVSRDVFWLAEVKPDSE